MGRSAVKRDELRNQRASQTKSSLRPPPIASSKPEIDVGVSKVGGDAAIKELVCRGDWRFDGGNGGKSSVIDRGCKSCYETSGGTKMYELPQGPMARQSGRLRGLRDKTMHATAADSSFLSLSTQVWRQER